MDTPDSREVDSQAGPARDLSGSEVASDGHEILLVEDNPGDVSLFRLAVAESNLRGELHVATTGAEALALLDDDEGPVSATSIDIVVLDLNLPDRSGLGVLEELKRDASLGTTPVLILSTSDDRSEIQEAYELGASAYLVKRMAFEDTVALVNALDAFWLEAVELPE